jgi:hypothetical protein
MLISTVSKTKLGCQYADFALMLSKHMKMRCTKYDFYVPPYIRTQEKKSSCQDNSTIENNLTGKLPAKVNTVIEPQHAEYEMNGTDNKGAVRIIIHSAITEAGAEPQPATTESRDTKTEVNTEAQFTTDAESGINEIDHNEEGSIMMQSAITEAGIEPQPATTESRDTKTDVYSEAQFTSDAESGMNEIDDNKRGSMMQSAIAEAGVEPQLAESGIFADDAISIYRSWY